ncbi:MAG: DapH/DapD/GlmU-related protein [Sulfurimonas sp.]
MSIYTTSEYTAKQLKKCGNRPVIYFPTNVKGGKYVTIGDNFLALSNLRIEAIDTYGKDVFVPNIIIGHNVKIGENCHIGCINRIHLGNNVLIASNVYITDHFHGNIDALSLNIPPAERKVISKGSVIIEDNVWIGEGVAIMPNIRLGKNSIIGANAVVTKDIPENCVAGGIPAKVIKYLI